MRRERFDWASADEEEESYLDDRDDWAGDDDLKAPSRRSGAPARRGPPPARLALMDLCTPIFGYAAILPREGGGIHPGYAQFRQEVMTALQRVESESAQHGIDREDAADGKYALALFIDEQVADSDWSAKDQWASEPLYMVLLNDPEGGVHFFEKLASFGDRRRAVKEVYLVCLAMGYRGKYAELDPTQQAAQLGEVRQKTIRSIHPDPIDSLDVLFPEGYEGAAPIEDVAPPPPRLWVGLSLGGVALAVIIYIVLFVWAGRIPRAAEETLKRQAPPQSLSAGPGAALAALAFPWEAAR